MRLRTALALSRLALAALPMGLLAAPAFGQNPPAPPGPPAPQTPPGGETQAPPEKPKTEAELLAERIQAIRASIQEAKKQGLEAETDARDRATDDLLKLGEKAIPVMEKFTEDLEDPVFGASVRDAMLKLGWISPEMREQMAEILERNRTEKFDSSGDGLLVQGLGKFAVEEVTKELSAKLKEDVRVNLVTLLGELGKDGRLEVLPTLLGLLADPMFKVRGRSLWAIAHSWENEDQKHRDALAKGLDERRAVPIVLSLLRDDEQMYVRRSAARCLGILRRRECVEALIEALDDKNPYVREHAHQALVAITAATLKPEPAAWKVWWERAKAGYPPQVKAPPKGK
ncbi:MAG: HEAT repeat domain-containing protein [Planctomycetales bacterium]|nr:HEAT repeat domain-containing protein [Planctomycetales bacterium]